MIIVKDKNNFVLFAGEIFSKKENIWFDKEEHTEEIVGSKPSDFRGGHYSYDGSWVKTELGLSEMSKSLTTKRLAIQEKNKAECKSLIYARYDQEFQNNVGLNVMPAGIALAASTWIFNMREEENRVFDLLEASDDPESVETPTWPEV